MVQHMCSEGLSQRWTSVRTDAGNAKRARMLALRRKTTNMSAPS